jgi:response regulator RpfG family c-di-GMP phosphodiesterase
LPIRTLLVHPAQASPRDKQLELSLSLEGLEVAVTRAPDALGSAASLRPDLIVIDADVGEPVSAEVTGGLRKTPQTESTPIVLLTDEQYGGGTAVGGTDGGGRLLPQADPGGSWEPYLLHGLRIVPVGRPLAAPEPATEPEVAECGTEALVLTLVSAALLVDFRVAGTLPHLERVVHLALALHEQYGNLAGRRRSLVLAGLLHDLGKTALRPGILDQQAPLRLKDWFRIYTHPLESVALLARIPFLRCAIPACRSLHERWDGHGYPDGLAGCSIPAAARLIGLCEAYDAMRSPRRWRPALSAGEVRDEIRRGAGTQFDPQLVDAFLDLEREFRHREAWTWDGPDVRGLFDRLSPRPWQVLALTAAGIDITTCSGLLGIDRSQISNYYGRLRRQLRLPPRQGMHEALRERIYPRVAPAVRAIEPLLAGEGVLP